MSGTQISLQSESRLDTANVDLRELGCGWPLCDGVQSNVAMFWDQSHAGKAKQEGKGARPTAREEYQRQTPVLCERGLWEDDAVRHTCPPSCWKPRQDN